MPLSRRRFLQALGAAGVAIPAGHWLLERLEAYASERLALVDLPGPGLTTFSRTICRDCPNHCSLAFRKVDELPVGVRGTAWHPASRGGLCPAGQSQMQGLFDPDRLRTPLIRDDAGGEGRAATWDEAFRILSDQITPLVQRGAGDRIAIVDGRTPSLGGHLLQAWVGSIPGARYVPLRTDTALDRIVGTFLPGGADSRTVFDLENAGMLLCAGAEILEMDGSPVSQMRAHADRRESRQHGNAPTVYLGPRQSPTAVKADRWLPCPPGQERSVLLALAEGLSRNHPDRSRILPEYARYVPEARDPLEFARLHSLDAVSRDLGLRQEDLEDVLVAFSEFQPSVCLPGASLLHRLNGAADATAALALNLWTGGFRREGGLSRQRDPLAEVSRRLGIPPPVEHDLNSLGEILDPLLEIRRSPIDVLICVEANPAHELPGHDQIERALSHVPFVATLATHEDETSRIAHLTLPILMSSETWDLPAPAWGVPEPAIQIQRPAIKPVTEGLSVEDVLLRLPAGGAEGKAFRPPAASGRELVARAVDEIVSSGRGTLIGANGARPLRDLAAGIARDALLSGEESWTDEPGGAVGAGPVSVSAEPVAPLLERAPGQIWLVPFDAPPIQSGRVLNRPMMMELSGFWHGLAWESWIEIHPSDAERLHIRNGDRVRVRGPRAEIVSRAVVTRSIVPGVTAAPLGFGHEALGKVARGHGARVLDLPNTAIDARSGVPVWGPVPVFIDRVGGGTRRS